MNAPRKTPSPDTIAVLTRRWYPLRPHWQQGLLYRCQARFVAVPAGRRSGKTEIAKRRLVRALAETKPWHDPHYFFGAPTSRQAKRVAWFDLLDLIPDYWIAGGKHGRNVSHSELVVRTVHGSMLYVVGLDNPQRIEGTAWDGCVLDESSDLKPGTFDRSVQPALADRRGWCWRIGVPKRQGIGAAEYRRFCGLCHSGEYQDGQHFTWPSRDILPAAIVAQAQRTLDSKDFREQYEACWETAGGQIFHAFSRQENVRPCPYDPKRPILVGSDFNVDPMCWTIGHRIDDRLEWFDELFLRDANTPAALDVLYSRYASHQGGWEFFGDASSSARRTSAARSDLVQIATDERFETMGRSMSYCRTNPPIADRFSACNALFCNAQGQRRMFVDPDCRHLVADLEARYYRPGTRRPADFGDLGHMTDAMGYVVWRLFPIRLPSSPETVIL